MFRCNTNSFMQSAILVHPNLSRPVKSALRVTVKWNKGDLKRIGASPLLPKHTPAEDESIMEGLQGGPAPSPAAPAMLL